MVVACSAPEAATDASTSSAEAATGTSSRLEEPTTTAGPIDQGDLVGWETATITVGETELLVAMADDPEERRQGLMGVQELGDLHGMLFRFPDETLSGFWMKGTLMDLDIVFFGVDNEYVDRLSMVPCSADACPSYFSDAAYLWALEIPTGTLGPLSEGAILSVGE